MMFCKNCGAKLPENAKFCPQCATPVNNKENSQIATNPSPAPASSSSPRSEEPRRAAASSSPAVLTKSFGSMIEADNWLAEQDRIIIKKYAVKTGDIPGDFANHPVANQVIFQYVQTSQPTGFYYGLAEEEILSKRDVPNTYNNDFHSAWNQTYPSLHCASYHQATSTRTTYSGQQGGTMTANAVSSYTKYFVLYQEKGAKRSYSLSDFGKVFQPMNEITVNKSVRKSWIFFLYTPLIVFGLFSYLSVLIEFPRDSLARKYHNKYFKQWIKEVFVLAIIVGIISIIVAACN